MLKLFTSETKNLILKNSILLFAKLGYSRVTMRQIALESNIEAASIYNHYESKLAIMDSIFDYFDCVLRNTATKREDLIKMMDDKNSPHDILRSIFFRFPETDREYCVCCIKIFHMEQFVNERAQHTLMQVFYVEVFTAISFCLNELIKRKMIEKIDVNNFAEAWARCVFFLTIQETHPVSAMSTEEEELSFMKLNEYLINCSITGGI